MARRSAAVPGPAPAASFARSEPRGAGLLGRSDAACGDPDTAADPGIGADAGMRRRSASAPTLRVRKAALVALLAIGATGCTNWVNDPDLLRNSNAIQPGPVRVLTNDGGSYVLQDVSVANDTLSGWSADGSSRRVRLPLNAIKNVEKKIDMSRGPQSRLGVAVLVALSLIAFVFGATHAPQM